jgi:hypothetical protein
MRRMDVEQIYILSNLSSLSQLTDLKARKINLHSITFDLLGLQEKQIV